MVDGGVACRSSAFSARAKKNSRDFYWQHVHILRLVTSRSPFGGELRAHI